MTSKFKSILDFFSVQLGLNVTLKRLNIVYHYCSNEIILKSVNKMKQSTHVQITKMVADVSLKKLDSNKISMLLEATIEPDKVNEELMMKDLAHLLTVPFKWLVNHTLRSKSLALLAYLKRSIFIRMVN